MGQMRDEGLFSNSKLPEDRYVVIYVETNVENPDLFKYLWDMGDADLKRVKNCEEIAHERVDQWNQWESLIVVAVSK